MVDYLHDYNQLLVDISKGIKIPFYMNIKLIFNAQDEIIEDNNKSKHLTAEQVLKSMFNEFKKATRIDRFKLNEFLFSQKDAFQQI
jgi:hypothetical protein